MGFREKPLLDFYVSAGHYFFKKHIIDKYFPDSGNFEETVLPRLARERILMNYRLAGKWITLNTMKDYLQAKDLVQGNSL
jgi:NDP-sugar pyrophosphorylase family protein